MGYSGSVLSIHRVSTFTSFAASRLVSDMRAPRTSSTMEYMPDVSTVSAATIAVTATVASLLVCSPLARRLRFGGGSGAGDATGAVLAEANPPAAFPGGSLARRFPLHEHPLPYRQHQPVVGHPSLAARSTFAAHPADYVAAVIVGVRFCVFVPLGAVSNHATAKSATNVLLVRDEFQVSGPYAMANPAQMIWI